MKLKKYVGFDGKNPYDTSKPVTTYIFVDRKPLTLRELVDLLCEYDFGVQATALEYMKQFRTWDNLYDDLERRLNEKANHPIRNVTPEKPKQLRQNNE